MVPCSRVAGRSSPLCSHAQVTSLPPSLQKPTSAPTASPSRCDTSHSTSFVDRTPYKDLSHKGPPCMEAPPSTTHLPHATHRPPVLHNVASSSSGAAHGAEMTYRCNPGTAGAPQKEQYCGWGIDGRRAYSPTVEAASPPLRWIWAGMHQLP